MTRMTVGDLDWEVRVRGTGRPVLLLHGFMGRGASWRDEAAGIARDFRAVLVDLPGHGRSGIPVTPGGASVERSADDIATILERVACSPAHVVGYSLGARVALRLAIAHPTVVLRLVLESPSAGIADVAERGARRAADAARAERLVQQGMAAFVDAWEREPVLASLVDLPPRRSARLRSDRLRNRPAGLAASLRDAGQGSMEPLHGRLAAIRIPTLVIAGGRDPVGRSRAEAIARAIPDARLQVISAAGHAPHLETPSTFRSLLSEFLKEDPAA